jgi:hypothetical protein
VTQTSVAVLPEAGERVDDRVGQDRSRWRVEVVLLMVVVIAAVAHRLHLLVTTDFPINDGGLFVPYIEASRRSFPGLPESVSYNGLQLPFAYPPAGFWIGGLLGKLGVGAGAVVLVLPILTNAVWIVLLALLLLRDGHSRLFTAATVAVVAAMFRSYEWLVMGGGLTRGLGAAFLVLTLLALGGTRGREERSLTLRSAALAGVCVGGAVLSHLEWGVLAAASLVAQRALCSRSVRSFVVTTAVAGGTAALLVVPWVLLVVSRHGLEPFLSAAGTSAWNFPETVGRLTGFARAQWPNLLLGVGGAVLLVRRHLFWPVFVVLAVVLTPRHSLTPLVLPVSYLTATGLEAVILMVRRAVPRWRELSELATVSALTIVAVAGSYVALERSRATSPLWQPLSVDVRAGMAWVRENHPGTSFAVITDPPWYYDGTAEWFPVLSSATSSTTVQGTEWLPGNAFRQREEDVTRIKLAPDCEELVRRTVGLSPVRFVWTQTRPQCFEDAAFSRVFSNPEVSIFEVPAVLGNSGSTQGAGSAITTRPEQS